MRTVTARNLLMTVDPLEFVGELGFTPDPWQERVLRWTGKRLIMNCSRQSGKSTISAILALHQSLYFDNSLTLLISPSLRQSSELFRRVGDFLDRLYIRPNLIEDNKLSCTLSNKSRIVSLPSSESTIRGFSGVDLIVEDEASRVSDDLYRSIRPMLAVSNGRLILLSTPFGKRGHFFTEWTEGEGWERVLVPASECSRITEEFLQGEMRSLGSWFYRQEYGCEFMDALDQVFTFDWIQKCVSSDVKPLLRDWGM